MKIGFLHTTRFVLDPISEALGRLSSPPEAIHVLDEGLLAELRSDGSFSEALRERVLDHARWLAGRGASALVVSCSSVSKLLPFLADAAPLPLVRIDEAMYRGLLSRVSRLGVIATNPTTLDSSRSMAEEARAALGPGAGDCEFLLVPGAFAALASGDAAAHDEAVRGAAAGLASRCEAIVLAQISAMRSRAAMPPALASRVYGSLDFLGETLELAR